MPFEQKQILVAKKEAFDSLYFRLFGHDLKVRPFTQTDIEICDLKHRARRMYLNRRKRMTASADPKRGEPAWEALLAIYAQVGGKSEISLSGLCSLLGYDDEEFWAVVEELQNIGLMVVRPQADGLGKMLSLTDFGYQLLDGYIGDLILTNG